MSVLPVLEDFTRRAAPADAAPAADEATRLASWEQGYKAGWDDAVRTEAEDQARIGADFARSLQELSFTFHEARAQVIEAMEPLLTAMVDSLFPALAAEALAATVREEIAPMLAESAGQGIEIVLSPAGRRALETHVAEGLPPSVTLVEEETLAEGQAFVRTARSEIRADIDAALARMRDALTAYFHNESEERRNHG